MKQLLLLSLALALLGCDPQIGDSCSSSSTADCPSGSFCDRTMPGGYCTASPCFDDDDCPAAGVCIHFDNSETYCMAPCDASGDCRKKYTCIFTPEDQGFCGVSEE